MLEKIIEQFPEAEFLKADGFDDAITGVAFPSMRLIYSVSKFIQILMQDMDEDDAEEYFYYNTSAAYMGEKTPIWDESNL